MKKKLFSRFTVTFLSIILISFTALGLLISSMVSNYVISTKRTTVRQTAESVSSFLSTSFRDSGMIDFNRFTFYHRDMTGDAIYMLAANSERLLILVVDIDGNVILDSVHEEYRASVVSLERIHAICTEESGSILSDLDGLFTSRYLISGMPVLGGTAQNQQTVGYVLVCSPSASVTELTLTVVKTVFVATLWVMLAALIAVYFISARITNPLKTMSHAAKSYAAGKFDVRVPVQGEDEITELAIAFNNMANSLQNLESLRSSFVSSVSHELRTPMTSISGFIDGILSGAIPPDKQSYYLGIVADEVRRLSRLVTSLLDISRIEAGDRKFVSTAFDICEMARLILISFEKRIDEKHLDVVFKSPDDKLMVYADRDAIYQVLYNICDNAVKFSKEGGRYSITIVRHDKRAFVSVYNEGIGIASDELSMVFDRFYKSDKSRGLDKKGVGLGMYIAKTVMDAQGQEIWVKSEFGKFCEFTFTLQIVMGK